MGGWLSQVGPGPSAVPAGILELRQVALAGSCGVLAFREAVPKPGPATEALVNLISPCPRSACLENSYRQPEKNRRKFLYL